MRRNPPSRRGSTASRRFAAYQAAALELNQAGRLLTLEGDPAKARIAQDNLKQLGLGRVTVRVGRFQNVLPGVLAESPVDYAFIDGHHDEQATLQYFKLIAACTRQPGLLVFDDIWWSQGMRRAWDTIRMDQKVRLSCNLGSMGLCLLAPGPKAHLQLPLA